MTLFSRLLTWLYKLPPAETCDVIIERDIEVPMPDGVVLLADRHFPRGSDKLPTILMRTPYGRAGLLTPFMVTPFAQRGFQVLIQSCRGTFGSGGVFNPFHHERADGLATLAWLKRQPWFSGNLGTFGPSYLGYVQWAFAPDAGPELKAMVTPVAASELRSSVYAGESFWLDTALTWISLVSEQSESVIAVLLAQVRAARAVRSAIKQLPLRGVDETAAGKPVPFFRDWLEHNEPDDAWWKPMDFSDGVPRVTVPVHLIGGWYDVFARRTIADYIGLRQAGRRPYLTMGPWSHTSQGLTPVLLRESITWLRAHLLGDRTGLRDAPVRLFVMGSGEWMDFLEWPPPGIQSRRWYLHPGARLSTASPVESAPDRYCYDPADPTPSAGGASLSRNSGPKDNRALEARPDVLVYTGNPLERDLDVIGPVEAELHIKSTLEHTDFFVRLCDVHPGGKSINLCDGLLRLAPGRSPPDAGGFRKLQIELLPTAARFKRGHRIRVQVTSGAHPRFARNPGSGEPLATATTLVKAHQSVYHDPAHPSAIVLPVLG